MQATSNDYGNNQLTSHSYWNKFWKRRTRPVYQAGLPWVEDWFRFQQSHFPKLTGISILEVGCGASRWLPIYASKFGYKVFGIDYDLIGCKKALDNLSFLNQEGEVICEDFLNFAPTVNEKFDIVVSFGFVEHFTDNKVLLAMHKCLKPEGMVFATVPNFQGLQGMLFNLNQEWKPFHVAYSPETLCNIFEVSGFEVTEVDYASGFGIPVPRPTGNRKLLFPLHLLFWGWISMCWTMNRIHIFPKNLFRKKSLASSIMIIARKRNKY
jgi:SAM-dependent methyltransferase